MADEASRAADETKRELARLHRETVADIRRLLAALDTAQGEARLLKTADALATATRVRRQIEQGMREAGVSTRGIAESGIIRAAEAVAGQVDLAEFSPRIRDTIDTITGPLLDDVVGVFGEAAAEVAKAVRSGVATQGNLAALIDDVARIVDTTAMRAQAAVDSAIIGTGREMVVDGAERAQEQSGEAWGMLYTGPMDAKTRPWCRPRVGVVFPLIALKTMDNGTDLPAATFGGGYNCRHTWTPMPLADARQRGLRISGR